MVHGVTTDKCLVETLKMANKAQSLGQSNMQKVISDLSRMIPHTSLLYNRFKEHPDATFQS